MSNGAACQAHAEKELKLMYRALSGIHTPEADMCRHLMVRIIKEICLVQLLFTEEPGAPGASGVSQLAAAYAQAV